MSNLFLVVGSLNTDIIGVGVPSLVGPGDLAFGGSVCIAPGGKARNVAQMLAAFPDARVSMLGKTGRDPFGLWRVPIDALVASGVDVEALAVDESSMPGVALIPVDGHGKNQIYVLPGANERFLPPDVASMEHVFERMRSEGGSVLLSFEVPVETAAAVANVCSERGVRILVDPGGVLPGADYAAVWSARPALVKPNRHEAEILTGISVHDHESAREAAGFFRGYGVEVVMITAGADGAYVFADGVDFHVRAAAVDAGSTKDETGCGDQAMACVSYGLSAGWSIERSVRFAIEAAGMQFQRAGVQPLSADELRALGIDR